MFVLKQSESYVWPVTVEFPIDGGKFKKESFDAEFKRISESRIKEATKQVIDGELNDNDFAKEILVGWASVSDENGNEVPYTESTKAKLLDFPLVAKAIVLAFFDSLSGTKRKN